jgi:hypothetical protein
MYYFIINISLSKIICHLTELTHCFHPLPSNNQFVLIKVDLQFVTYFTY